MSHFTTNFFYSLASVVVTLLDLPNGPLSITIAMDFAWTSLSVYHFYLLALFGVNGNKQFDGDDQWIGLKELVTDNDM